MSKKIFLQTPSLSFVHNFLLEITQNHKWIFRDESWLDFPTFLCSKFLEKTKYTMQNLPLKSTEFKKHRIVNGKFFCI